MKKIVMTFGALAFVLGLTGCQSVQSVGVDVNPVTGTIGGSIVFKNGRWIRQTREVDSCGNAKIVERAIDQCTPAVRAVDQCGNVREVRAEVVDLGGGGVRGLVAVGTRSTRVLKREAANNAKAVQQQERDAYEALKEIHKAEDRRLDRIVHANSQTAGGKLRRAFSFSCPAPVPVAVPVEVVPADPVVTVQPTQPSPPVILGPDTTVTPAPDGSFSVPPASKAVNDLTDRVAKLEANQKLDHDTITRVDKNVSDLLELTKKNQVKP